MDAAIKGAYKGAVQDIEAGSTIERATPTLPLTERAAAWYSLAPSIYVIGGNMIKFDSQANNQGFQDLVSYAHMKSLSSIRIPGYFRDWIGPDRINTAGCHISHALVAKDFLQTDHDYALIFENDCAFHKELPSDLIKEVGKWVRSNNIGMLNLGTIEYVDNTEKLFIWEDYYIKQDNGPLTQSYLISREQAQALVDTLNTEIPKPEKTYRSRWSAEKYYRTGADEYFIGFTLMHALYPSTTYQQPVRGNRGIIPGKESTSKD